MKTAMPLILLAGVALLTGCGPTLSVHPLYTEKDLVSDLPLEGTWTDDKGEGMFTVRKSGNGFEVLYTERSDSASAQKLDVHLLRLRDFRFVDVAPRQESPLSIPGHLFAKVWMEGSQLHVAIMDSDWLKQKIVDSGFPAHRASGEDRGKQIILTAPTEELQKFVLWYAAEEKAFDVSGALHRVP